jgi:hypothetical protein
MQNVKHPSYLSCLDTCEVEIETVSSVDKFWFTRLEWNFIQVHALDIITVEDDNNRQRVMTW